MATLEGIVRQTTDNPLEKFELEMLTSSKEVIAYKVVDRDGDILIETQEGFIPIYMFKINTGMMNLLRRDREVWDG
ncbi:MAG: hypothetical protein CMP14_03445 [Rickettsiales bacterium]|nr:hypothetical protein [Rickettsiales bacterium]|tara:strand:+ start:847 stop:1074 length:228 start_codon:yes stop_codon:yes gene_type:complete